MPESIAQDAHEEIWHNFNMQASSLGSSFEDPVKCFRVAPLYLPLQSIILKQAGELVLVSASAILVRSTPV